MIKSFKDLKRKIGTFFAWIVVTMLFLGLMIIPILVTALFFFSMKLLAVSVSSFLLLFL